MKLEIGQSKTFKLPIWLTAVDMLYEQNGLRLERQRRGIVALNVNSGRRRDAFAAIPLGRVKDLNEVGFTVKVHSKSRTLFSVGAVRFVIDYNAKKVATNLLGLRVLGSKEWGENVQIPWRGEFQTLFGLPMPAEELDRSTAALFWQWFANNEVDIINMVRGTKQQSKSIFRQVNLWLCPAFPYEKQSRIDFDIICKEIGENTFVFRHGGSEKLMEDAEAFGEMMPENMAKRWHFVIEE